MVVLDCGKIFSKDGSTRYWLHWASVQSTLCCSVARKGPQPTIRVAHFHGVWKYCFRDYYCVPSSWTSYKVDAAHHNWSRKVALFCSLWQSTGFKWISLTLLMKPSSTDNLRTTPLVKARKCRKNKNIARDPASINNGIRWIRHYPSVCLWSFWYDIQHLQYEIVFTLRFKNFRISASVSSG